MIGDMIVNSTRVQTTMKHTAKININRYESGFLTPVTLEMKFEICSLNTNNKLVYYKINRILYFIQNVLDKSVFITPDQSEHFAMMINAIDNNVVFCPQEPRDEVISLLLYSKFNAMLGNNKIHIGDLEVVSSDNMLSVNFESYAFLNNTNASFSSFIGLSDMEYCSGFNMVHNQPWWDRDDGFTYDFILPEDDERDIDEFYQDVELQDPLSELPAYEYDDEEYSIESKNADAMIIKLGTNGN
jgi:hypothetical protein